MHDRPTAPKQLQGHVLGPVHGDWGWQHLPFTKWGWPGALLVWLPGQPLSQDVCAPGAGGAGAAGDRRCELPD